MGRIDNLTHRATHVLERARAPVRRLGRIFGRMVHNLLHPPIRTPGEAQLRRVWLIVCAVWLALAVPIVGQVLHGEPLQLDQRLVLYTFALLPYLAGVFLRAAYRVVMTGRLIP